MNIQSMDKRDQILETTLALIATKGLNGSPMSLIAKESGVAIGTIYHHFKSKEEIINVIYLNKKKNFKLIFDRYENKDLTFKNHFEYVWHDTYTFFIENPLIFQFTQQIGNSPIITPEVKEAGQTYFKSFFDFYQEGIDQGIFIKIDLTIMGQLIFGNILSLVELKINGTPITNKTVKEAINFSWRAISNQ